MEDKLSCKLDKLNTIGIHLVQLPEKEVNRIKKTLQDGI